MCTSGAPSFFTILPSRLDGEAYLVFAAVDGKRVSDLHAAVGIGGVQVWRTDGSAEGTRRAFQRSENDLYVDKSAVDLVHPAHFTVYNGDLYLPGNNGNRDALVPRGGIRSAPSIDGIPQAAVVSDVDTPPTGNLTLLLEVDKGVIVMQAPGEIPPWSSSRMRLLIGEHVEEVQMHLYNAFTSLGHLVDIATGGDEVVRLAMNLTGTLQSAYDAVFIELNLPSIKPGIDGLNAAREIRYLEKLSLASALYRLDGNRNPHMQIIGIADINTPFDAKKAAEESGMDNFYFLPVIGSLEGAPGVLEWDDMATGRKNSSQGAAFYSEKVDKIRYDTLAKAMESFLFRRGFDLNVTALGDPLEPTDLPAVFAQQRRPSIASSKFFLQGTVLQVNFYRVFY